MGLSSLLRRFVLGAVFTVLTLAMMAGFMQSGVLGQTDSSDAPSSRPNVELADSEDPSTMPKLPPSRPVTPGILNLTSPAIPVAPPAVAPPPDSLPNGVPDGTTVNPPSSVEAPVTGDRPQRNRITAPRSPVAATPLPSPADGPPSGLPPFPTEDLPSLGTPYLPQFTEQLPASLTQAQLPVTGRRSSYEEPATRTLTETTERDAIVLDADFSHEWSADGKEIGVFFGRCRITQGSTEIFANQMVIWRSAETRGGITRDRLRLYCEGNVQIDRPGQSDSDPSMLVDLVTSAGVEYRVGRRGVDIDGSNDGVYLRALGREKIRQRETLDLTQMTLPYGDAPVRSVQIQSPLGSLRRVRLFPRYGTPYDVLSFESQATTPPEQVWVLTGGINVLVDSVQDFGTVDLSADRVVIWTRAGAQDEFRAETVQTRDTPFQVYLEGNVVIRQGTNVLRAAQAVYDARDERALLNDAELRSFIPQIQGDIRIRAQRLRQQSQNSFHAQGAFVTSSQFGKPGYRLEASDIFLEDRFMDPLWGEPGSQIDPVTGQGGFRSVPWVTALNTKFYVEDVPLLYLPKVAGPAEDPGIPIRQASVGQDRIFGFQTRVTWDMHKLLGLERSQNSQWDLYTDILTDRGFGLGTGGTYAGNELFGIEGPFSGRGIAYFINDGGEDNLGNLRRSVAPEKENRYRLQLRHRQRVGDSVDVIAELGLLSDRNFLEQYWENEWDEDKDHETRIYIKQQFADNAAWTALGQPRLNDFETETEWFPKADLFILGEQLFENRVNWSSHTSAGYGSLRPGVRPPPGDPFSQAYTPIDYIKGVDGPVLMTRHEFEAPFQLGPLSLVPFVGGEADFWGEALDEESLSRLVGTAGIRSSMSASRIYPHVYSRLFNVNGLAHKMVFEADYYFTESTADINEIAQYNEIDDNAQQRYRTRFPSLIFFNNPLPQFDARSYAIRRGVGRGVADPYHELIDDQQVVRLAWRHRLQTKTGRAGRQRVKDWMTLDLEASYFPEDQRDNFGEELGLMSAAYTWSISDRTIVSANAQYDFFDNAQELWNVGVSSQRGERGSIYLGVSQVKGANLDSQVAAISYTYRMSPKWISTFGTGYDLNEDRNIGQSVTLTRVGADFLFHLGANFDASKDNAGILFAIEPRFGPPSPYSAIQFGNLLPTFTR